MRRTTVVPTSNSTCPSTAYWRMSRSATRVLFVCAGIARKTGRLLSMKQLTQGEASANEGNRHTTSQPTDCSIPSSSLPTAFSACSVRPHSVHLGDHGAVSFFSSSSLPSSSSSSCSSSLSLSLSVVSMPLSSSPAPPPPSASHSPRALQAPHAVRGRSPQGTSSRCRAVLPWPPSSPGMA